MNEILRKLIQKEDLTFGEIQNVIENIATGKVSDAQIGAFLVALTRKGVNEDELFAFASAMRKFSNRVIVDGYVVDSCGTGADLSSTINVSTAAALVANAAGVKIVKQTNSSITSACGSTDFLQELGLEIARNPEEAVAQFNRNNITFVHSPLFNEFAKVNNPIRRQIGIKTIFNYLGPLINPAFPQAQLLGVSSSEMCEKIAGVLHKLDVNKAIVVNGIEPNIDEISVCSKTKVYELKDKKISEYELSPQDFGLKTVDISAIQGGSPSENVELITQIFTNKRHDAMTDIISLNAGAMLYLAGFKPSLYDGVVLAQEIIKSGVVYDRIRELQGARVC